MPQPPTERKTREIAAFLDRARSVQKFNAGRARLIFAMDATASRQPTWDLAISLQADMFRACNDVAPLSIQLAYYRGLGDLSFEPWQGDPEELARRMSRVSCAAGRTQLGRLLRQSLQQQAAARARGLVFIGDAVEESPAALHDLAGRCRLQQLPLFIFQEGEDRQVTACFRELARLSGGAYSHFDARSPGVLAALLGAVARFAAGGRAALEKSPDSGARLLLDQLPH